MIAQPPKAEVEARGEKPARETCWSALGPSLTLVSGYVTARLSRGPVFCQGSDVDFPGRSGSRFPIHWVDAAAGVQNIAGVILAVDDTEWLFQQRLKQIAGVLTDGFEPRTLPRQRRR